MVATYVLSSGKGRVCERGDYPEFVCKKFSSLIPEAAKLQAAAFTRQAIKKAEDSLQHHKKKKCTAEEDFQHLLADFEKSRPPC